MHTEMNIIKFTHSISHGFSSVRYEVKSRYENIWIYWTIYGVLKCKSITILEGTSKLLCFVVCRGILRDKGNLYGSSIWVMDLEIHSFQDTIPY